MRKIFLLASAVCYTSMISFSAIQTAEADELFVSDRATNRVLSFDEATGEFLRVVTDTGLDEPSGLSFGPDGYLYVSNFQGGLGGAASVVRVDPVTGDTTDFISDVTAPGGLGYHASSDTLLVSEFIELDEEFNQQPGNEVFRYDAAGNRVQTLGTGSANTGRSGIAFDEAGNLYVSETNLTGIGNVLRYDAPEGDPADDFGEPATTFASGDDVTLNFPVPAGGFNGLSFDLDGDFFVASLVGQSLIKYSVSEGMVTEGEPFGAPLAYPSGVLVKGDSEIFVTSLGNDNPDDPIYGDLLFPGTVRRFNALTQGSSPLLKGDATGDAVVDGSDLAAVMAAYGDSADGDLNGDHSTDGHDFLIWQRGFGNEGIAGAFQPTGIVHYGPSIATVAVPEPSALMLSILGSCLVCWRRRL